MFTCTSSEVCEADFDFTELLLALDLTEELLELSGTAIVATWLLMSVVSVVSSG